MPLKLDWKSRFSRKHVTDFILSFILCYIGIGAVLYMCQRDFIYMPDRTPVDLRHKGALPLVVETDDELKIRGWYMAPAPGKPVVVFFHGNTGNAEQRDYAAVPFIRRGFGFLFAEYRGYGGNPGEPSEKGFYSDARAYINWLLTDGKIAPERLILFGESIGTGPAVKMADEHPDFAGLILVSPYTSLTAVAQKLYPVYPASLMVMDKFDNLSRIGGIKMPILMIHGRRDRTIPFSHAEALKKANANTEFVAIDNAGHNDIFMYGVDKIIAEFIGRYK